jgi:hypothetical protein
VIWLIGALADDGGALADVGDAWADIGGAWAHTDALADTNALAESPRVKAKQVMESHSSRRPQLSLKV